MVCRTQEQRIAILWDDENIYGFVEEPTEYQRQIVNSVNKLPILYRKVVILFAFERVQRAEIAKIMSTSLSAVRLLIHRGGLLLQEHFAAVETPDDTAKGLRLQNIFHDWPCLEYAKLVEIRKNITFLD